MPGTRSTCRGVRPTSATEWLQRLHEYRLYGPASSLRPRSPGCVHLRQRERLLDYAAAHIQHMQKALMQMNLQLHHVVSDVTGVTGMTIIRAIVAGERDPNILASHRERGCHASVETICQALIGNYREEHVFALSQALELYRRLPDEGGCLRQADRGNSEAAEEERDTTPRQKLLPQAQVVPA